MTLKTEAENSALPSPSCMWMAGNCKWCVQYGSADPFLKTTIYKKSIMLGKMVEKKIKYLIGYLGRFFFIIYIYIFFFYSSIFYSPLVSLCSFYINLNHFEPQSINCVRYGTLNITLYGKIWSKSKYSWIQYKLYLVTVRMYMSVMFISWY